MTNLLCLPVATVICILTSCASTPKTTEGIYRGERAVVINGEACAPDNAPAAVKRAIAAVNRINELPYQYGGGHGRDCYGLDCSGTASHVLRNAGLLDGSMPSDGFKKYGRSGPGRYITVFARDGHVFLTICGLRLDTTSNGNGHVGPRWHEKPRNIKGFTLRHPPGL